MFKLVFRTLVLAAVFFTTACSNLSEYGSAPFPELPEHAFGERPNIPSQDDIFALPDYYSKALNQFADRKELDRLDKHEKLFEYIKTVTRDLYYDTRTNTSTALLSEGFGNCLSLAVLTGSLADELGVDVTYEVLNENPVYETNGSIVNKALHVRTVLIGPVITQPFYKNAIVNETLIVDFFPEQRGDNAIAEPITIKELITRFHLNVAADLLAKNQLDDAYWYAKEAIQYNKRNIDAANLLAVLYKRKGDPSTAKSLYNYALSKEPNNISILKNYRLLAKATADTETLTSIDQKLRFIKDPSPLEWVTSANEYLKEGKYRLAATNFKRAIEKAPYLHEAYLGLAKSYTLMGNQSKAEKAMMSAFDYVENQETRSRYKAKWISMRNL